MTKPSKPSTESAVTASEPSVEAISTKNPVIDCDIHVHPNKPDEIKAYLQQPWKSRFRYYKSTLYTRPDLAEHELAINGKKIVTDPESLRKQWIEPQSIVKAILVPRAEVSADPDRYYASAVAAAYNDWLSDTWLGEYNHDGLFKGSITVAHQDPEQAAQEIGRWKGHPHFVQVLFDSGARAPFGQPHYYPIYEACVRNQFPLAIHPGADGYGRNNVASQGYPSHYLEYYTALSFSMQSHLVSMLTEGVFERFPELKIVIAEGGFAWLPSLMWRLDTEYKALRSEIPWVKKAPSHYLKDHVRFTTQPLERPSNSQDLLDVFDMVDAEQLLMYSSDYPDGRLSPLDLPAMQDSAMHRIRYENARSIYRL
jgi:predicted TIM-barrel fold metal-dependent hydrolase